MVELNAELRDVQGKGASRRLRHANKVPAIVYGAGKDPQNIMLEQKEVLYNLPNEAFYSQVLSLNVAGKKEDVLLRDLQHHPYKIDIMHKHREQPSQTSLFVGSLLNSVNA